MNSENRTKLMRVMTLLGITRSEEEASTIIDQIDEKWKKEFEDGQKNVNDMMNYMELWMGGKEAMAALVHGLSRDLVSEMLVHLAMTQSARMGALVALGNIFHANKELAQHETRH